jgi:hypothetical protein
MGCKRSRVQFPAPRPWVPEGTFAFGDRFFVMTTSLHETGPRADRDASISLASGLLALAAVCVAIMPVPFTGYICFPAAVILAALAGVYSVRALRRFRVLTGNDRAMSFAGLIAGTATLALTVASVILIVMLGHRLIEAMWRIVP